MRTLEEIKEAMEQRGLAEYYAQMEPFSRNVIQITP